MSSTQTDAGRVVAWDGAGTAGLFERYGFYIQTDVGRHTVLRCELRCRPGRQKHCEAFLLTTMATAGMTHRNTLLFGRSGHITHCEFL